MLYGDTFIALHFLSFPKRFVYFRISSQLFSVKGKWNTLREFKLYYYYTPCGQFTRFPLLFALLKIDNHFFEIKKK